MGSSNRVQASLLTALWLVPGTAAAHDPAGIARVMHASLATGVALGLVVAAAVVRALHWTVARPWPWLKLAAWMLGLSALFAVACFAIGIAAWSGWQ